MHEILEEFCDKWVWPTMPGAPGAEFRLKLTREQCLKGWEILLERNLRDIEEELASNDEEWKRQHGLRGAELLHRSQCLPRDHGLPENGRRPAGAARAFEPTRRGADAFHGGQVPARHVLHDARIPASCRGRARLPAAPDRRDPVSRGC